MRGRRHHRDQEGESRRQGPRGIRDSPGTGLVASQEEATQASPGVWPMDPAEAPAPALALVSLPPPSFLGNVKDMLAEERPFVDPGTQLGLEARQKRKAADSEGPSAKAKSKAQGKSKAVAKSRAGSKARAKAAESGRAEPVALGRGGGDLAETGSPVEASAPAAPVIAELVGEREKYWRSCETSSWGSLRAVYGAGQSYIRRLDAEDGKYKLVVAVSAQMTEQHGRPTPNVPQGFSVATAAPYHALEPCIRRRARLAAS